MTALVLVSGCINILNVAKIFSYEYRLYIYDLFECVCVCVYELNWYYRVVDLSLTSFVNCWSGILLLWFLIEDCFVVVVSLAVYGLINRLKCFVLFSVAVSSVAWAIRDVRHSTGFSFRWLQLLLAFWPFTLASWSSTCCLRIVSLSPQLTYTTASVWQVSFYFLAAYWPV